MTSPMNLLSTLTYLFLFLAVLMLWWPRPRRFPLWYAPLAVSFVLGYVAGHLTLVALLPILAFALSTRFMRKAETPWKRGIAAGVVVLTGLGLGAHLFPGFHNLKVLDGVRVSPDGIPFTLHWNFDKTLVGIFILGELHTRIHTGKAWLELLKKLAKRAPLIILAVAILSLLFQFVRFDPKIPDILPIWACTNLLFVCVAEEGFFRGFLQKYLAELWQDLRYGQHFALAFASVAFGVAHFAGGITYVILATLAGFGYGGMYRMTGRIEAGILTHFLLNLFHIVMLTYPALMSSL